MIKNVIFDIGQVLVAFHWKEFIKDMFEDDLLAQKVGAATVGSPLWKEVDRGEILLQELIDTCANENPDISAEIRAFFARRNEIAVPFPFAKEWVEEVKACGKKVYLLSNYSEEAYLYLEERADFIKLVDGKMISYTIKKVKPEREIYQALLDTYHILPEESIFLDDVPENLKAAKDMGFQTLLVEDQLKAREELLTIIA